MQCNIELLYQNAHQCPIGKVKAFSVAFARGLLAEMMGYAVDRAGYAMKARRRGKKMSRPFESFEDLKAKFARGKAQWPKNEVQVGSKELESARNDWEINKNARKYTQAATFNLGFYMDSLPSKVGTQPLWGSQRATTLEDNTAAHRGTDAGLDQFSNRSARAGSKGKPFPHYPYFSWTYSCYL